MGGRRERNGYSVYLDAAELGLINNKVGTLYRPDSRVDAPIAFEYDDGWLQGDHRFMLDPRLELWTGEQYPPQGRNAFGIFTDSAPDRWGRVLMERREALASRNESRPMRTLSELDFLLGVHDLTRSGALRFKKSAGGPFLDDSPNSAPPVTSLPELADIVRRVEEPGVERLPEYEQWLALLIAPGSSLGGARPKANFTDSGKLWIAKFPANDDRYDVGAWEFVVHNLARRAGIDVPESRLHRIAGRHATFCVARFDRADRERRMFVSAMTLLERTDSENASYLDLAELISDQGASAAIATDLEELFRRVVFGILVGNRDDHLRNHGFIRTPTGWRLSPAYDLNPNPYRSEHVLTFDGTTGTPDVNVVLEIAEFYRLTEARANVVVEEVNAAVRTWQSEARRADLSSDEIDRMSTVFQVT